MKKLLLITLLASALVACGPKDVVIVGTATPEPISELVEYSEWADDFASRWDDAVAIASATSRMSLAGPLGELQALRREVASVEIVNPQLKAAHRYLELAADGLVEGFLSFMSGEDFSDEDAEQYIRDLDKWGEMLSNLMGEF